MVASQVARRGVTDERVLDTMRQVPREVFVGVGMEEFAYEDSPLPIAAGQTISQPYIVALMIAAAQIKPSDRVLDVGTGSGYAAAVLSRLAAKVYSIERHRELANSARRALERLGYNNVEVRHGDGTLGWADAAPFDAILVAAGGPEIPEALRRQLKIGGRLVIPIGELGGTQELVKVIRDGEDRFHEEDLGPVTFVPLIGEAGWQEPAVDAAPAFARLWPRRPVVRAPSATELIRQAAEPLPELDNPAFGAMFDRFAKARVVLLGEATHGTSEFYRARAQITRRLIEQHGFNIVAVEADWPDAARIDRYIRHKAVHVGSGPAFRRFPQWIWRNVEVANFVDWLRAHNAALHPGEHAGFFGLDIYNMNASIEAVIGYLDRFDPEAAAIAKERYGCLTPWQRDPATYGRAALTTGYAKCEQPVLLALRDLLNKQLEYGSQDRDSFLDAAQNARLVASAERYYRAMYYATAESWNLRDRHMFETLNNLMEWRGADAKAVVWAHNSHVGNAAATDMGRARDEINIGQLCREKFGDDAALIGFGTDRGTVAAADDWDGPMKVKTVRPAHPESYEYLCKDTGIRRFLLDLRKGQREELRSSLMSARLERAIGVIYRPETELASHYFDAHLPAQFDGYVWFEETRAVKPLPAERQPGLPETYPFGL
ncbi:MAG: protein-L-isoaspartate(D-aspartate) O-methyltransferase [Bradyrhizobium sp.]|nr:protein-L-isoaspartate(D-aspartate) O-methyltransferase [Pseudomonadota bacterium]MDE2066567.1 protein-L-isoaspartate(D-aspartate) O-methyltransferase [Bradyrhizobium sp.]MDE2467805.1 protein-L-isoaspartate(D-aspartate) O-methyltransferase [Bradyrhizobium sp.]